MGSRRAFLRLASLPVWETSSLSSVSTTRNLGAQWVTSRNSRTWSLAEVHPVLLGSQLCWEQVTTASGGRRGLHRLRHGVARVGPVRASVGPPRAEQGFLEEVAELESKILAVARGRGRWKRGGGEEWRCVLTWSCSVWLPLCLRASVHMHLGFCVHIHVHDCGCISICVHLCLCE